MGWAEINLPSVDERENLVSFISVMQIQQSFYKTYKKVWKPIKTAKTLIFIPCLCVRESIKTKLYPNV